MKLSNSTLVIIDLFDMSLLTFTNSYIIVVKELISIIQITYLLLNFEYPAFKYEAF